MATAATWALVLLLATPAWGMSFAAPDRAPFFFCGDATRFQGATLAPCGLPANMLGVVAYVGPFTGEPVVFHAEADLFGPLATMDATLWAPPDITIGVIFALLLPECCWDTPTPLTLTFTLPDATQAFDLTYQAPVPEPATLFLVGTCFVLIGLAVRRRTWGPRDPSDDVWCDTHPEDGGLDA